MNFTLKKQLVKVSEVHKCKSPLENFHEVSTLFPNSVALHCPQCCPIVRRFDGKQSICPSLKNCSKLSYLPSRECAECVAGTTRNKSNAVV